jgi:putative methionine-R-sulfoxide reductase with GAF domain
MVGNRNLRDYASLADALRPLASLPDDAEKMRAATDLLWQGLSGQGVHWLGFYALDGTGKAMVLVSCRPKPACSPIGLHGVCGRGVLERRAQVVEDCHALGEAHIVCDPANRSEVVVPLLGEDGSCSAVLDLDSQDLAAFTEEDARGFEAVLRAAGLTR